MGAFFSPALARHPRSRLSKQPTWEAAHAMLPARSANATCPSLTPPSGWHAGHANAAPLLTGRHSGPVHATPPLIACLRLCCACAACGACLLPWLPTGAVPPSTCAPCAHVRGAVAVCVHADFPAHQHGPGARVPVLQAGRKLGAGPALLAKAAVAAGRASQVAVPTIGPLSAQHPWPGRDGCTIPDERPS